MPQGHPGHFSAASIVWSYGGPPSCVAATQALLRGAWAVGWGPTLTTVSPGFQQQLLPVQCKAL